MSHGHEIKLPEAADVMLPENSGWRKMMPIALVIGVLGLGATAFLGMGEPKETLLSYLVALMFGLSIAVGALFFVTIQFLTRAGWSVTVRRIMEMLMLPAVAFLLLFIPVLLGMDLIYKWTDVTMLDPEASNFDPLLVIKYPYLNTPFFIGRSIFYLVTFAAIAWYFYSRSRRQDESGDPEITRRLQFMSAPAVMILSLVATFAGLDWMMTLDFHWFSTIYGVYWFAGSFLVALSVTILMALALNRSGLLLKEINVEHYHDLGKLAFGFVVFWTYIAFSQYFLIWYANIPEETLWYADRINDGWINFTLFLVAGHFIIPFAFMMSRTIKRNRLTLGIAAAWLVMIHYVDMYWLVMPTFHEGGPAFSVADVTALLGVAGVFFAIVGFVMNRAALVPHKDPRLPESMAFENF